MKVITFFLALILLASSLTYSQDNKARRISEVYENGSPVVMNSITPQVPFVSDLVDPVGTVTNLTTFADYVTNGNNLKKLAVLGDTIIVTGDYLDSNWAALSERRIRYNISYDGGVTWGTDILVVNTAENQAYSDLNPIILSGGRTVAISGRQYVSGSKAFAATDLLIGLGVFNNTLLSSTAGQDYFAWKKSSTELAGTYRSGDTIKFANYDYTTNTFNSYLTVAAPPTEADVNGRFTSAVSSNGQNIFLMWWISTADAVRMVGKESTDGGSTFGSLITLIPYAYIADGDSVQAWFGLNAIYKPGTTTKMAAFNTLYPGNFGTRRGSKLMFWSPGVNSGNPVIIADWRDTAIHLLNDSLSFENNLNQQQVGITAVSHPTLGYSDNGSRLTCVFSGNQPDTSSYGFNFNDIFISYSDDDGATWSDPKNVTNTPDVDEIYPSISQTGNLPGNVGVVFQVSDCPGSSSFTDTQTPRCPVYWVYRRYDPVTGAQLPIGVKSISSEIPNSFNLHQNFPNPFNPSTKIRFDMPKNDYVSLKVYDVIGREVRTLVNNEFVSAGVKEVVFNASDFASGIYFYTIETGDFRATKKMMLIK